MMMQDWADPPRAMESCLMSAPRFTAPACDTTALGHLAG